LADQIVGINSSELWVGLDPKADYDATVAAVEQIVSAYPGADCDVMTYLRSRFGEALAGVDEPIAVRLYGQELNVLRQEAEKVRQLLAGVNGIVDPHVELESEEPVVEIKVNLEQAKAYGVKPGDVRRAAATLLAGIHVGDLFEEQKVFEVVVWGEPQVRHSISRINDLLIDAPEIGGHVRLGDVASVSIVPAPDVIRRQNVARRLDVVANVNGRDVDAVAADVHSRIRQASFPLEYRAELLGDFAEQQMARNRVLAAALGSVIGILLILQAAFGSWTLAISFLLTLPVALAGGVIAAAASGSTLSVGSAAGFLAVLGIAVRQGMLLISRYRDLRYQDGHEFGPELVRRGTRERATPILMSGIVLALAVVPFVAFGARPGNEILGPVALVILGGLVTSTLYVLCVVPALYARFGASAMPDTGYEEDLSATQRMAV
jgi:Cu/Ag efflux pump CusA